MANTVNSAVKRFMLTWNKSVEQQYAAAKIYKDARDTWNTAASRAFHELAAFAAWTDRQWTLLYHIGADAIPKCYLNFSRPTLPLAMNRRKIPAAEQEKIYQEGVILADLTGRQRVVTIDKLQNKHIHQLYDTNGNKRSILQQLKWLRDHQQPNLEVLQDGTIHVRHRCYISKDQLLNVLTQPPYPLSATDCFQLAQKVKR